MKREQCMNCGGNGLREFLDLGAQPNGNRFPAVGETDNEPIFPMAMMVCETCWQVQIAEFPSQDFLFDDHPYVTGVNVPVVRHFEQLVPRVISKCGLQPNDLAIDVGCNDGSLLRVFAAHGVRVLGVDPGKTTGELARDAGITVLRTFFNRSTGEALAQLGLTPDVITATAVFYHVPDLHDFIEGLRAIMGSETVFVVQGVNLRSLIERNQFDHFYHEHSCIHAVGPLKHLFAQHDLRIFDIEFSPIHGGSFIIYVVRTDHAAVTSPAVEEALRAEEEHGLQRIDTYEAFAQRVEGNSHRLKGLLTDLKDKGKSVFALGAPVKGSTLLNYCGIGPDLVSCATEVNDLKIGRLTPGTHIPVVDEDELTEMPDYYLVLSWNFLDFFRQKYDDYLRAGGRFIVPVPEVRIVGPAGSTSLDGDQDL